MNSVAFSEKSFPVLWSVTGARDDNFFEADNFDHFEDFDESDGYNRYREYSSFIVISVSHRALKSIFSQ